jgi:predicted DNA-binding transcriptional regulator YafY
MVYMARHKTETRLATFQKGKRKISLCKGKEKGQVLYWIEEENGEKTSTSRVSSFSEAMTLLNNYPWPEMDMEYIHPTIADQIAEARASYGGKMPNHKVNSQLRILQIFLRFLQKERLSLEELQEQYGKHPETLKKDIEYIRIALDNMQNLKYDRQEKKYYIADNPELLTIGDSLVLLLMLYHSRVLNEDECQLLVEKLIKNFSLDQQGKLKKFFQSYKYHYKPVQNQDLLEKIDILFNAILDQYIVQFEYSRDGRIKTRKVIPYSIIFHDGMFYLAAHKQELENTEPVYWRLDKMSNVTKLQERFRTEKHIDLGLYRMQSFNMFTGELMKVRIKMKSYLQEYLYRECVKAKEIEKLDDEWSIYELEVRGSKGIILWLLQQKDEIEVLSPPQLREEVKDIIRRMYQVYH